jgi:[CysO sulfur-carrier protein]-S-L-cysteine hydrolase
MNLVISPGILELVIGHAKQAYPNEGCGLLAGWKAVERFIAMKNVSSSPSEYEMDPAELLQVLRELRNSGEQLLAIYHSHPHGPAELSKKDIERACYPEAAQVVVSLADLQHPECAAFRVVDGVIIPIELHVIV